jgi:hypothetical protein
MKRIPAPSPLRVKLGSEGPFPESPLYPDEPTSSERSHWSVRAKSGPKHTKKQACLIGSDGN